MKSKQIKDEMDNTNQRITELEAQQDEQAAVFEAAQQEFIKGKGNLDSLHAEQSKLTLISQTIESLRATYQRLKSSFEEQSEKENRRVLLKQMALAAKEVEPLFNEYLETRKELNDILADYAQKLIDKTSAYRDKQHEYQSIINQLEPPATEAELSEIGIDPKTQTLAKTSYINRPPVEYDQAIVLVEQLLAGKINRAAQAKRNVEFNKQRETVKTAYEVMRREENVALEREFEAERQRIIKWRADNELPAFSPEDLDIAAQNNQALKAEAKLRGAKATV